MNDFIAIDFETAEYAPESAISIGLVKYRKYRPIASYYSLIRPPNLYIRPDFTDIHGLTIGDVKDAPDFKQLWENGLGGFVGGTLLAAHNADFDMRVLGAVLAYYAIPVPELSYFCSLKLARRVWPALPSHALTALAKEHNIVYEAHNALADADTCAKIIVLCAEAVSGINDPAASSGVLNPSTRIKKKPPAIAGLLRRTGLRMQKLSVSPAQPCPAATADRSSGEQ